MSFGSPLRRVCSALAVLALVASATLLAFDAIRPPFLTHSGISAAPLLCIGLSYVCLQGITRPPTSELLQRLMLGGTFILWGIDQLLPPGAAASAVGDIVITLYVIDLGLIIRGHLKADNGETP
jgi:hypothetical protein